jgi:hypothetical protein
MRQIFERDKVRMKLLAAFEPRFSKTKRVEEGTVLLPITLGICEPSGALQVSTVKGICEPRRG